jgi:predicted RNA-binding protein YlqC (UPF0109 family)
VSDPEDAEYTAGDINTLAGDDYQAGDVNTLGGVDDEFEDDDEFDDDDEDDIDDLDDSGVDDLADVDDEAGNRADEDMATGVLVYLARSLADEPEAVVVQTDQRGGSVRLRLHVAPDDMGRIIGRRGRTAQALRTLVAAAGARQGVDTSVDIVDD